MVLTWDLFLIVVVGIELLLLFILSALKNPIYLVVAAFVASFSGGVGEIAGIQPIFFKLVTEFSIFYLFIIIWWQNKISQKNLIMPAWQWMLILFIISFISFLVNSVSPFSFLYFLRILFVPYIFLICVVNIKWNQKKIDTILKTIFFLYLVQLPAALVKLVLIGPAEVFIGTISIKGGSITTVLVMLASSYIVIRYIATRKKIFIILLVLFMAFGMIGLKRALIVYIPVIFIFGALLYSWKRDGKIGITTFFKPILLKNIVLVSVGSVLVFYAVVRLNPTLNPEGLYGGSFDIDFVLNYMVDYNTRQNADPTIYTGRLKAPQYVWAAVSQNGFKSQLIGLGAGIITASRFVEGSNDYLGEVLGLGYGARNGIWFLLLQVGIVGLLAYLGFIFYLLRITGKQYNQIRDIYWRNLSLVSQLTLIVYLFDTLTYSNAMMMVHSMILPVMWLIGVVITPQKQLISKAFKSNRTSHRNFIYSR